MAILDYSTLLNLPLHPWQESGAKFLLQSKRCACLDTVGVGKTIESLAAVQILKKLGRKAKALILVEGQSVFQWCSEIKKFTGEDAIVVKTSAQKQKRIATYASFAAKEAGFLVFNYGKTFVDFDELVKIDYNIIIFDEASVLSNINNTHLRCLWLSKKREFCWALTATPMSTSLLQIFDLLTCIGCALPHSRRDFIDLFCVLREDTVFTRKGKISKSKIVGAKNFPLFKEFYSKFYIRRTKRDIVSVQKEIQKNYYYNVYEMSKQQQAMYTDIKAGFVEVYRKENLTEKHLDPLTAYTTLIQALDSPYLIDNRCPQVSPKIIGLLDLVDKSIMGEKCVIYSHFKEMGRIVKESLDKAGFVSTVLHGDLKESHFEANKAFFLTGKAQFLVVTDIAKRSLNLQVAPNIIFIDLPFVPNDIFQLIGRLDRLGQVSPMINIFFLLMDNSIEKNRIVILRDRQKMFDYAFDDSLASVFSLSKQEFIQTL